MNNNFYKKLIEDSPTGYAYHRIIFGGDGLPCDYEFIEVNTAFETLTGLKRCDIIGKKITEILPDIRKNEFDWIQLYGDIAINGGGKELEQFSELLNRWYKVYVYSPEKYYFITLFTDVSKEKSCSTELSIIQQRLANIIKSINAGTWDWNVHTGEIIFNSQTAEIIGLSLEKISPLNIRTWERFIHPEDLVKFNNQLNKIIANEIDYFDIEMRLKHKNGNWVYVWGRGKVISWASDGNPLFVSGTYNNITDRKQAEKALRQASQYARNLIETSLDPLVTISAEGIITDVNTATEKVTGVSRQKLIGRDFVDFFTEPQKARAGYLKVFEEGQVINYPLAIRHTSGKITDVLYNASVYRNEQGEVLGVFAAARDITDQKKAEEESRQASQYARNLIETSLDPLVTISAEGIITDVNTATEKVTGVSRQKLIGRDFVDFFTEPQKARAGYLKVFEEGQVINYPLAIRHTSGKITDVLYNASVYRNEQGEVLGVFAAARDITDQKKAEEALQLSLKYRLMTENVIDMISRQSLDGKYTYISPSCERILGYAPEELIGVNPYDLLHPESVELSRKYLKAKLKSADIDISTNRIRCKNGSYVWLETSKKIIADNATNEPTEILCVSRDVTTKIEEENLFKKMVAFAEELLRTGHEQVTYSKILENLLYISKAEFGVLTLLNESNEEFTVVASAGAKDMTRKIAEMLGFELEEKEWIEYFNENKQLNEKIASHFSSVSGLSGKISVGVSSRPNENKSGIEEVTVLNVIANNQIIGDFTLVTAAGKQFENSYLVEIYSRQVNMFITRIKAEEEILNLSYHDQLTRLYNRRFYEEELKRLDTERNYPLTIAMGDVNGLKLINDSFGHTMGDELLKKVAGVIKKGCRADDIIARLGGDEFVIILPKTNPAETEKVIKRIKDLALEEKAGSIDISISFGYETKNTMEENIQDIFKNAEDNMYRHKLSEGSSMRSKTIDLIMNTLFEKNDREMLHSEKVSRICKNIAACMDFNEDSINQIRIAGLMHDIGKTAIDDNILNKPGEITVDDWKEIERHSEIGYRILSSVNEFSEIADYILEHHEKYNGKGYPRGLKGEEISLQARIIAIADAFEYMTCEKSYGNILSEEEAIDEIKKCSGTHFDPAISKIFVEKVLGKNWD